MGATGSATESSRCYNPPLMPSTTTEQLLGLLGGSKTPSADEFKQLVQTLDNHRVLAKVFLLEGTPYVFEKSPMKYVIFREQVADRFNVGSQDVCIVGSAKLGFSPSPFTYGVPFSKTSDVDVVIISEPLFYKGSSKLFWVCNGLQPSAFLAKHYSDTPPIVRLEDWAKVKEAIKNFVYENFNPGLLPHDDPLRIEIFENMASTSGLFLALEPKVMVSKIRCRIFRTWKAAEDYYSNSLREAKQQFMGKTVIEPDVEDAEEKELQAIEPATPAVADKQPPKSVQ
jgi:hypothetical protein